MTEQLSIPAPDVFLNGGLILRAGDFELVPYHMDLAYDFLFAVGYESVQEYFLNRVLNFESAKAHIQKGIDECLEGKRLPWMIRHDERVIGAISLTDIVKPHRRGKPAYVFIEPKLQRQGIALTAARAVTEWAFMSAGFHRLEADIAVDNGASFQAAMELGFINEGVRRKHMYCGDGVYRDMANFAMLREDYLAAA
ncbi:GNAT family N-acetyltransferase [Shimazuella kribbensis]|uniref:GNAT family N-acetyltransferase n=1 Tax=Shimazuella kribbensis TaxID=139808 RepID=UPI00048FF3FD|nr:GNAT family protein [Shimazuella kribbensis]